MMQINKLMAAFSATLLLAACSSDEPGEKIRQIPMSRSQQEAVYTQNNFSMRLLRETIKSNVSANPNVIISPISVSMDMCMIASATDEETAHQIYEVLGFNEMDVDEISTINRRMINEFPTVDRDAKVVLANSVWADKSVLLLPEFARNCLNQFNAELFILDIHTDDGMDCMNNWCSNKTRGLIPRYLDSPINGLEIAFVNVTYFSSPWTFAFDEDKTAPATFHNIDGTESTVDMMNRNAETQCWQDDNEVAVRLIYGNGAYSMYIALPKEGVSLDDCIAGFDEQKIKSWNEYVGSSDKKTMVDLYMPRFSSEYSADMTGPLSAMGASRIFSGNNMLPGIAETPLRLGYLSQKSRIDVSEKKTEVASVTYPDMPTAPGPIEEENIEIHLDRPFFYWISERSTGAILFTGAVVKL